jgi:hypothetical protein
MDGGKPHGGKQQDRGEDWSIKLHCKIFALVVLLLELFVVWDEIRNCEYAAAGQSRSEVHDLRLSSSA